MKTKSITAPHGNPLMASLNNESTRTLERNVARLHDRQNNEDGLGGADEPRGQGQRIGRMDPTTCSGAGTTVPMILGNRSTVTDLRRQQARRPSGPANRPYPESFTPPNGRDCIAEAAIRTGVLKSLAS